MDPPVDVLRECSAYLSELQERRSQCNREEKEVRRLMRRFEKRRARLVDRFFKKIQKLKLQHY